MSPHSLAAPPTPWPQPLIELLERQESTVERLAALARAQGALIAERHTDGLLDLLAQRQAIIDEFTASQADLSDLTRGLDERLQAATPAQRERIKSLIASIGDRLAQIMQRDDHDQALLRNNRDQVKAEINTLSAGKQARNAYLGASPADSGRRYADRRG